MSGIPDSSLFDIAPQKEIVVAGGKRHEIVGVPFGVFLRVGRMWPPLIKLLTGGGIDQDQFSEAPEAVSRFIAAGFGLADNQQAIDKASSLPLDIQMDLFSGILKATLGGGGRPFAGKVNTIVDLMATGQTQSETSGQNSSPDLSKPASDKREKPLNAGPKPLNASSRPAVSPQ